MISEPVEVGYVYKLVRVSEHVFQSSVGYNEQEPVRPIISYGFLLKSVQDIEKKVETNVRN